VLRLSDALTKFGGKMFLSVSENTYANSKHPVEHH